MFDGLRNDASNTSGFEEPGESNPGGKPASPSTAPKRRKSSGKILGMTAQQRFFIAVLLFVTVCLLGTAINLVLGKFVLP